MPGSTVAFVTSVVPDAPSMMSGPSAVSVQSAGTAVPPLLLVTCLTSVSCAGASTFVSEHVADSPSASVQGCGGAEQRAQARGARPRARRVARRSVRLEDAVAAGIDRGVGDRGAAGHAGDRRRSRRVQRPVGRDRGAAEEVLDGLDQREMRGLVVVDDRARRDVVGIQGDGRRRERRRAGTRPRARGVRARRRPARLGEVVRAGGHDLVRHRRSCRSGP